MDEMLEISPEAAAKTEAHPRLRRVLASVFAAFAVWLTCNSLATLLAPKMTPAVQSMMLSHRAIGVAFTLFVVLYVPLHIVAARGLSKKSAGLILSPLKNLVIIVALYRLLLFAWGINRFLSIPVVAGAYIVFEVVKKGRPRWLRAVDAGLALLLIFLSIVSTSDGMIRIFVLGLGGYCSFAILLLFLKFLTGSKDDHSGVLLLLAAVFMTLFSMMMVGGTNSGKYNRYLPVMDYLHYATSALFLAFIALHVWKVSRMYPAMRGLRALVSVPVVLAVAAGLGAVEFANVRIYGRFATPILSVSGVKPKPVSEKYLRLKGYYLDGHDDWYVRPLKTCGNTRCHPELSVQHNISAHGRAFDNAVFKKQLKIFIDEKGRAAADYCIACHAPLGVVKYPGDSEQAKKIDLMTTKDPAYEQGVSCIVCHRAVPEKDVEKLGNTSMTIRPLWLEQERYLGEELDTQAGKDLHRTLIHAANRLHKKTWHVPKEDWNYICASCHVVKLPEVLSCTGKSFTAADQFTSFMASPYAKAGLRCAACHQQRFATYMISYNTVDHHYLGSGTSLPYPDKKEDAEFREISLGFINGYGDITLTTQEEQLPPCLDDIDDYMKQYIMLPQRGEGDEYGLPDPSKPHRYILDTGLTVRSAMQGRAEFNVRTKNQCDGHSFPSGGGLKAYLEITVFDRAGKTIGKYGGLGPDGRPLPLETTLGSRAFDEDNKPITDRRFWRVCGVLYKKRLDPAQTISNDVTVEIADGAKPAKAVAVWYYLRPEYLRNLEDGVRHNIAPVEIGRAEAAF